MVEFVEKITIMPCFIRLFCFFVVCKAKEEQGELHTMISQNPDIGDVVPKSGGVRKVRFARQGGGKSSGVRVIYYNRLENGKIFMLLVYAKAKTENIPAHILKDLVKELDTWQ